MKVRYKFLDRSIFFYINITRDEYNTIIHINSNIKKNRKNMDVTFAYGKIYFKYGKIRKIVIPKNDNYIYCTEYVNGKSVTHDIYVDQCIKAIFLDAGVTEEKDEIILRITNV